MSVILGVSAVEGCLLSGVPLLSCAFTPIDPHYFMLKINNQNDSSDFPEELAASLNMRYGKSVVLVVLILS